MTDWHWQVWSRRLRREVDQENQSSLHSHTTAPWSLCIHEDRSCHTSFRSTADYAVYLGKADPACSVSCSIFASSDHELDVIKWWIHRQDDAVSVFLIHILVSSWFCNHIFIFACSDEFSWVVPSQSERYSNLSLWTLRNFLDDIRSIFYTSTSSVFMSSATLSVGRPDIICFCRYWALSNCCICDSNSIWIAFDLSFNKLTPVLVVSVISSPLLLQNKAVCVWTAFNSQSDSVSIINLSGLWHKMDTETLSMNFTSHSVLYHRFDQYHISSALRS